MQYRTVQLSHLSLILYADCLCSFEFDRGQSSVMQIAVYMY